MTKKELRAAMRKLNRGIAPAERAAASERIFARVELSEAFGRARTVGVFCSLADERRRRRCLCGGPPPANGCVPRVEGDVMRFFVYDPRTMRPGAFGIAEPGSRGRWSARRRSWIW